MRMIFLFLLSCLLCLGLGACSFINQPIMGAYQYSHHPDLMAVVPIRVIPIWIDKSFGEADLLALSDAISQWNYALNGYVILNVVDTQFDMEPMKIAEQVRRNGWLFMRINSSDPGVTYIPKNVGSGYYCIGFAERIGGNHLYLVRDRLSNDEVQGVTMHEIGHLLGSPHVGDRLMRPHFSRVTAQCIDGMTMQKVAEWQGIPFDKLNYCMDVNPDSKKKP
jgi:hypothetical protein